MTDIWFYHLERQSIEHVLPKILAGLYLRGEKLCVISDSKDNLGAFSKLLWSIEDVSFIPHGLAWEVGATSDQICFALDETNTNGADHLIYMNLVPDQVKASRRISIFFDGNDEAAVTSARSAWKSYRTEGHALKYWRQSETGRWEDQAAKTSEAA